MVILKLKHHYKSLLIFFDADIDNMLISNKVSLGKKGLEYFIGYKDDKKVKPLCIMPPKMSVYTKRFDEYKCVLYVRSFIYVYV